MSMTEKFFRATPHRSSSQPVSLISFLLNPSRIPHFPKRFAVAKQAAGHGSDGASPFPPDKLGVINQS